MTLHRIISMCIQRIFVGHDLISISNFLGFVVKTNPRHNANVRIYRINGIEKFTLGMHENGKHAGSASYGWTNTQFIPNELHKSWANKVQRRRMLLCHSPHGQLYNHVERELRSKQQQHILCWRESQPRIVTPPRLECSPRIFCALQIKTICYALKCFCYHIEWLTLRQAHILKGSILCVETQASHQRESKTTVFHFQYFGWGRWRWCDERWRGLTPNRNQCV